MTNDKDIKKEEKKESEVEKSNSDLRCCYVVDPCGCYVNPCCC